IQEWLKANPLRIGVPNDGTVETITQQIARGDKHVHVRVKAWNHIVAELHGIPGVCEKFTGAAAPSVDEMPPVLVVDDPPSDAVDNRTLPASTDEEQVLAAAEAHPPASPLRGKIRAGKVKTSEANQTDEEPLPIVEKKSLSQMSMMERQQEWLRKKAEKAAVEKQRQQEEADKELTFQPALKKASAPRPSTQAPPQAATDDATKTRSKSAGRHRKALQKQDKPKTTSSLLDSVKHELAAASSAAAKQEPVPQRAAPPPPREDAVVAYVAKALENMDKLPKSSAPTKEVELKKEPVFHFGSSETKGRVQLQDPALFDLTSIYRKKDKYARRDGVSLQMGRRDDTHDEQIIAIFFDREHFKTESDANDWFHDHKQRLLSYM
ncbi:hypothetical protein As57867_018137, partial [Aphanomyces stellatus]